MSIFGRKSTVDSDAATSSVATAVAPELAALTGDYTIDPSHSTIGFVARHAMVTNVKGSFQEFTGSLHLDGTDPAGSTASLDITMNSIETGSADRDGHLKSADFFRTDEFPTMTFRSTKAESLGRRLPHHRRPGDPRHHQARLHRPGVQRHGEGPVRQRARGLRGQGGDPALGLGPDVEHGAGDGRGAGVGQDQAELRHLGHQERVTRRVPLRMPRRRHPRSEDEPPARSFPRPCGRTCIRAPAPAQADVLAAPPASPATAAARRAARMSGVRALSSGSTTWYRPVLPSAPKAALARGSRSSAATRSSGTEALRWDSYAASQRPSALAASDLREAAGPHQSGRRQLGHPPHIDHRPLTARPSRGDLLQEVRGVEAFALPRDPSMAEGHVIDLSGGDGDQPRALLRDLHPQTGHPRRRVGGEPGVEGGRVGEGQDRYAGEVVGGLVRGVGGRGGHEATVGEI